MSTAQHDSVVTGSTSKRGGMGQSWRKLWSHRWFKVVIWCALAVILLILPKHAGNFWTRVLVQAGFGIIVETYRVEHHGRVHRAAQPRLCGLLCRWRLYLRH